MLLDLKVSFQLLILEVFCILLQVLLSIIYFPFWCLVQKKHPYFTSWIIAKMLIATNCQYLQDYETLVFQDLALVSPQKHLDLSSFELVKKHQLKNQFSSVQLIKLHSLDLHSSQYLIYYQLSLASAFTFTHLNLLMLDAHACKALQLTQVI